ncbi:hypothetical protein [Myxococcus sp. AM010]|uniref:hypothetical protein n=1 Tax=Myxococcus sp. AM010 TaxID=2745138 RepID=UPI001596315C|nr:hypothetical protein [Myxococcus sp. AM010]NVJ15315.1 hypothetical protein [Myxococcus sp. AM010]
MSLLTDTTGRPERVHTLLRLLEAHGGRLGYDETVAWLQPPVLRGEKNSTDAAKQTIGSARSLGFIRDDGPHLLLDEPSISADPPAFADLVHARLRDNPSEKDRVMLEVYALFVVLTDRAEGTSWIEEKTVERLADEIDDLLPRPADDPQQAKVFNKDKYSTAWRPWMLYLGLGWEGRILPTFFPHPTVRLERELPALSQELGVGRELDPADFLRVLARRMPYLDGGTLFEEAMRRVRWRRTTQRLTVVLSDVLRELHDDGRIRLHMRGDTVGATRLAPDPTHGIQAISAVELIGGQA